MTTEIARLTAAVEQLQAEVRIMRLEVATLRPASKQRDIEFVDLVSDFLAQSGHGSFNAVGLKSAAAISPDRRLHEALAARDAGSVRSLGKLLARLEGQFLAGRVVRRVQRDSKGWVWEISAY